ncbi:DUF4136 domain-containing protein [Novosphingobium huizhouense]|uniref:DUF4136 domain-containing protein n=1 Tax=Novosphingobium huizhouense TaxID=2866625 RepID=UPI001CD84DBD|nr:DUF4136 domain-containing protein [Novosphingobium huizhouense]
MTYKAPPSRRFALLLVFGLAACATTPRVATDYDPSANFAGYHTYAWARTETPRGQNPLVYERVRSSIDAALAAKGFARSATPDFAVDVTLGARDRVETTDLGAYGPYYPGYGAGYRWGWAHAYPTTEIRTVTDGTMAIDIYDATTHRPVWHGSATKQIDGRVVDQALIDQAVTAALAKFPPQGR